MTIISSPLPRFAEWLEAAKAHPAITEPFAMALATAAADGAPSVRMVLLKHFDERGFVFYTNTGSRKGDELAANPRAALCLYWMPLARQIRIEGSVTRVSDAEADAYFQSRFLISRLGAWASDQSRPLPSREILEERLKEAEERFSTSGDAIPRPPYWHGFRVAAERIEFWQEGAHRLHDREVYTRGKSGWSLEKLYP